MKQLFLLTAACCAVSSGVQAKVVTYPAVSYCAESIAERNVQFAKLKSEKGSFEAAMSIAMSEKVGPDAASSSFIFEPAYGRTERYFTCTIPLSDEIGQFQVNMHASLDNINSGRPGGCTFSRVRRISDGGGWKILRFAEPGGFWWGDLTRNDGFVTYSQSVDNQFQRSTALEAKCRTTWDQGAVKLHHIELEY
ncbi:hypothetical protein [Vibrio proteolyticus]